MVNLHELNLYLKHHAVSLDDMEELLAQPRIQTPRKKKEPRESYEAWKLRQDVIEIENKKLKPNV